MKKRVTMQEGNLLVRFACSSPMPKKIGEETFDVAQRALADDAICSLRRLLKGFSPLMQGHPAKALFGDKAWWRPAPIEIGGVDDRSKLEALDRAIRDKRIKLEERWEMVDPTVAKLMDFSQSALEGVYWCLVQAAHPDSETRASVTDLDDVVWPLARKLGLDDELAKAIKLSERKGRQLQPKKVEDDAEEIPAAPPVNAEA